jgi:hypothetical protein
MTTESTVDDITTFVKKTKPKPAENVITSAVQQIFGIENVNATQESVTKTDENQFISLDSTIQVCSRCGRSNHDVLKCSANRDIYGKICPPNLLIKTHKRKDRDEKEQLQIQKRHAKQEQKFELKKKSNPCKNWKVGECLLGIQCAFSHDGPGFDPRSKQLCEYFRVGTCTRGERCLYSHKKNDFPCVFFHMKRGCKKVNCEYSHAEMTEEQKLALERDQKRFESRQEKKMYKP